MSKDENENECNGLATVAVATMCPSVFLGVCACVCVVPCTLYASLCKWKPDRVHHFHSHSLGMRSTKRRNQFDFIWKLFSSCVLTHLNLKSIFYIEQQQYFQSIHSSTQPPNHQFEHTSSMLQFAHSIQVGRRIKRCSLVCMEVCVCVNCGGTIAWKNFEAFVHIFRV